MGQGGDLLRFAGQEFGTTTGRPRRCGWLDIVALKYCCQINGFSSLNLTKLDVLSDLPEIQLGVAYKHANGTPIKSFPADLRLLEQLKVSLTWHCTVSVHLISRKAIYKHCFISRFSYTTMEVLTAQEAMFLSTRLFLIPFFVVYL